MVVQNDIVYNIKQQSPLNFALKIQKHLRKGANQFLIRQNYTEKERKMLTLSFADFECNIQQNKATERKKEISDADENEKLTSSLADPWSTW